MITIIFAKSQNGIFGQEGKIPWNIPEDLQMFKAVTSGHAVIMGHKTWLSLPRSVRPLPDRENIVLSRTVKSLRGAVVAQSLEDAFLHTEAKGCEKVFVIGGVAVINAAMQRADAALVTTVLADFKGDVHAPEFPSTTWGVVSRNYQKSESGLYYTITSLRKKGQ